MIGEDYFYNAAETYYVLEGNFANSENKRECWVMTAKGEGACFGDSVS